MNSRENRWYILIFIGCCLIEFAAVGIMCNCAGIFIHYVCEDLNFQYGAFSFYITIKGIVCAVSMPMAVAVLNKFDTRKVLCISALVFILINAAFKWHHALWQWYLAGVGLGITQAVCMTAPIPIILNNWYVKKRGTIVAMAIACAGIGGACFGPIVTFLIETYGWRNAYLYISVICLIIIFPAIITLRLKPEQIGLEPYQEKTEETQPQYTAKTEIIEETNKDTLKEYAVIALSFLISLCFTFSSHLAGYAQFLKYSVAIGSGLTSACMIGNTVGKVVLGYINDCSNTKNASIAGSVIVTLGIFLMMLFCNNVFLLLLGSLLYGMSLSMNAVGTPLIVSSLYKGSQYSKVISRALMANSFGGAIGVSIIGWIYDFTGTYECALIGQMLIYILIFFSINKLYKKKHIIQF